MLTAFRGESRNKIDAKGRVSVPADFRRVIELGDPDFPERNVATFTIVFGDRRQKNLKCYTELAIRELDGLIESMPVNSPDRPFLEHYFQTKSVKVQLDPNGRMVLPAMLREKSGLVNLACFAGTGKTFEIWNPADYAEHCEKLENMHWEGSEPMNPLALIGGTG